ncbi:MULTISPECIES: ABC transporter substrate-binding protein [unclassified Mesorhizobium]|uniref:ABC transporter substrate-binding protein n=1 Tax=unclassified Mesorhizobium TaxID=325217 RepID=UPI000FD99BAF|nr:MULTISPECIES: ABC transporter substrate-binding protein [unclassified Mesorhizobium]TGT73348.1 glycine/betaine ABC transporter substrate-binding protein [Mesorhizobium sp. M2E.F.Ca.ET.166.01.1.1]TGV99864.1 glycine/betaine ABC transporter substrate-binding protein [Mesorhizobium sp. M2E.F.Ca.ET.154.01.1.1]
MPKTINTVRNAGIGLALMLAASAPVAAADLGAKDEPIKLAMLEWTGAHVSTHIAGQLLEKLGYKVEYVTAGNFPQFSGLADGSLSASVEVWMNNVGDIYSKTLAAKQIEDIGKLDLKTREGWIYPKFMETVCPGLPDWTALNKPDCIKALSTPETAPNARFLDYPADWGSRAATILADNNMQYTAVPSGSEGALVAELEAAEAAKTPLIMMFWGPHYALAENDVGWVTMPPCKEQTNEHCITPPDVDKIVWSGFGAKWPAAYAFLKAFKMDAGEQEKMMLAVDKKGEDLDAVVKAWIDKNEAVWKPWVDGAKG